MPIEWPILFGKVLWRFPFKIIPLSFYLSFNCIKSWNCTVEMGLWWLTAKRHWLHWGHCLKPQVYLNLAGSHIVWHWKHFIFISCKKIVTFIQISNLLIVGSCIQQRGRLGMKVASYQKKLSSFRVFRGMS